MKSSHITFFILDFSLHIFDSITGLNLQRQNRMHLAFNNLQFELSCFLKSIISNWAISQMDPKTKIWELND